MATQTLETIKKWFKTGLKPTQVQFWDTWDSFRHKYEKVPVKDVDGIDELLLSNADKTVLNNHLSDKEAHAPQINTDWNSESGFSQLINKPEFKTINGEKIVGTGDISIIDSGSQNLQQTLNNGATAEFEDTAFIKLLDGEAFQKVVSWDFLNDSQEAHFSSNVSNFSNSIKNGSKSTSIIQQSNELILAKTQDTEDGTFQNKLDLGIPTSYSRFTLPSKEEDGNYTIATLDDVVGENGLTLKKILENGSEGRIDKDVILGFTALDNTSWSTIVFRDEIQENATGVGIATSGSFDVNAKHIGLNTPFGSISTGYNNQTNIFEIHANSSKLSLRGGAGGVEIWGDGKEVKISGSDYGDGAIQMLSTMSAGKITNRLNQELKIETQTALNINSYKTLQMGVYGSAATIFMEMSGENTPYININSFGNIRIGAEYGVINVVTGTNTGQGITVNNKHVVRTVNGIEADIAGNVILSEFGDMTTTTNQEVSGIKTFLSGKLALRNNADTFSSFLSNSNTGSRTYSLQDTNGTLMLSDAGNSNLTGYGQAVQVLSPNGTPTRGGNIINLFSFVQATPITINSKTLSSILTGTIFGNTTLISSTDLDNPMLTIGKCFSGKMFGKINAIPSATFNTILKVGSTILLDSNSLIIPSSLTNKSFEINYSFTVLSEGLIGKMIGNLSILIDGMGVYSVSGDPVTIDTTINKVFDIQFAFGETNAGNSITFTSVKGGNDVN
ncbi:hypothetical protein ACHRV6_04880 [Flavobacterium sp. FlaQc-51]|uniref:hypothetical protein n=1 Tax=Flavobacterium sp. FlaQc-51 TaxID=3374184 RepID=UPI003757CB04